MPRQPTLFPTRFPMSRQPRSSVRVTRSVVGSAGPILSRTIAWPCLGLAGLGHLAVQYAKAAGFETIAVSHSSDKDKMIRDLGDADEIVRDGKSLRHWEA